MIDFLKNLILDFCYGKKFKIRAQRIEEYKEGEIAFLAISTPLIDSVQKTVITGDDFKKISSEIPFVYQYRGPTDLKDSLVVPVVAMQYFKNGGTWTEIEEYNAVKNHGMLYGKRRRL